MTQALLSRPIRDQASPAVIGSLSKSTVASLPSWQVAHLSNEELVQAILAADFPFVESSRLLYQDRHTLERLAHLSRRTCRNQGF